MSLASQLAAVATRMGAEVKAVRAVANAKYTKPGGGIPLSDLATQVKTPALRWEQEILSQSGLRAVGYGGAPLGLAIPYAIRIKGVKYQFETATGTGLTEGVIMVDQTSYLGTATNLSITAGSTVQTITGLDIAVAAGSRLSLFTTAVGTASIGKGLYMSLWGEYDTAGL